MPAFPDIRSLIPHAGSMCLLERIESVDAGHITCTASSHRDPANPLRHQGILPVQAGIEYAAQAVAVHGGLQEARRAGDRPRGGMIAVLTDVHWGVERLDDIAADLRVSAEKLADMADGLCYRFRVTAGSQDLLEGELIVALQPVGDAA